MFLVLPCAYFLSSLSSNRSRKMVIKSRFTSKWKHNFGLQVFILKTQQKFLHKWIKYLKVSNVINIVVITFNIIFINAYVFDTDTWHSQLSLFHYGCIFMTFKLYLRFFWIFLVPWFIIIHFRCIFPKNNWRRYIKLVQIESEQRFY